LSALLRPFLAIQLQTALSHTAAALHAATRCKTSSPRAAKKLARDSSTARGNALNHHTQQPRAQKNSSRTAAAPATR